MKASEIAEHLYKLTEQLLIPNAYLTTHYCQKSLSTLFELAFSCGRCIPVLINVCSSLYHKGLVKTAVGCLCQLLDRIGDNSITSNGINCLINSFICNSCCKILVDISQKIPEVFLPFLATEQSAYNILSLLGEQQYRRFALDIIGHYSRVFSFPELFGILLVC